MQSNNTPKSSLRCSSQGCNNQIQATCIQCRLFFCFNCSLKHAQKQLNHTLSQFDTSIKIINQKCQQLLKKLKTYSIEVSNKRQKERRDDKYIRKNRNENTYDEKLNPQKFEQQLNYLSTIQKQTIKIIQKFFSQLSLQIVNIWQNYLNKYSNNDICIDHINKIIQKIQKFYNKKKIQDKINYIFHYYTLNLQKQVNQCQDIINQTGNNIITETPICPDIQIGQQMLIMISQMLCNQVSTKNYQIPKMKLCPEQKIHIVAPDTLDNQIKFVPIFPIRKQYCYLYNIEKNTYEIQEFDKLDFLPAFPKSLILWNGDIHLIGGANIREQILNTHIVFRSSTAQVFKLGNIPAYRNPVNGLVATRKMIYIIGGLNEKKQWDASCFGFDLLKKQWNQLTSMKNPKPHQSVALFGNKIFCFGIPAQNKVNVQQYNILTDKWKQVILTSFLCNPFNFASGFSTIQINDNQVLLFGGKKYLQNVKNQKRSTDRQVTPYMYLFQPATYSFVQLGALNPCIGVRDGQINPIIKNGKIYAPEYIISRKQPICRWLSAMHILEISNSGKVENILIMHED